MLGFRVWDSKDKCFCDNASDDGFFMSDKGKLTTITATGERIHSNHASDRYIPIQSTGLCDHWQGKLIFEGDIIEVGYLSDSFVSDESILEEIIETILVDNITQFLLKIRTLIPAKKRLCIKNIGNIYENPELLEKP